MEWNSIVGNCVVDGVATISCVPAVMQNVIRAAIIFSGVVAAFFIIYAGYKYIRSEGDPKQVEGARKTLTYAIIGLILLFCSFLIINFISLTTGVDCVRTLGFGQCNPE